MKYVQNTPENDHKISPETDASNLENNEENFNPHNCGQKDGISSWGAAILIVNGCIGCSALLMPYLMKNLGYVTGTIVVISSGIVYYHAVHSLLSTKYQLCKELKITQLSYVEVAEKTFQRSPFPMNKLYFCIRYLMYFFYSLPTTDAAYLVLIAGEIQRLAKRFNVDIKISYIVTIEIIPLTLFCLVPKILNILVPFSSVTNFLTLLMAIGTITSSVIHRKETVPLQSFGNVYAIPECIARCVRAYCCTGLILPIENDMKRPHKMVSSFGSLNVAASTVMIFYYTFGIILYANYGEEVQENVLFNLPRESYFSDGIKLLYTASLFVTYVLAFFNCFNNVWSGSLKEAFAGGKYEFVMEFGIRVGINMIAYTIAVAVPNLKIILTLAGTASLIIDVALPIILESASAIVSRKKNSWIIYKNLIIIGGCFILFSVNLTFSIKQIIALYSTEEEMFAYPI